MKIFLIKKILRIIRRHLVMLAENIEFDGSQLMKMKIYKIYLLVINLCVVGVKKRKKRRNT